MLGSRNEITLQCFFCGKAQTEVKKLVAGPQVYICDECIELCEDIIDEENRHSDEDAEPGRTRAARMMRLAERILDKANKERFGAAASRAGRRNGQASGVAPVSAPVSGRGARPEGCAPQRRAPCPTGTCPEPSSRFRDRAF